MKRRLLVPQLYGALFDLSVMRDRVRGMSGDVGEADAARLLSRLESAELSALRLLEQVENRRDVLAH